MKHFSIFFFFSFSGPKTTCHLPETTCRLESEAENSIWKMTCRFLVIQKWRVVLALPQQPTNGLNDMLFFILNKMTCHFLSNDSGKCDSIRHVVLHKIAKRRAKWHVVLPKRLLRCLNDTSFFIIFFYLIGSFWPFFDSIHF